MLKEFKNKMISPDCVTGVEYDGKAKKTIVYLIGGQSISFPGNVMKEFGEWYTESTKIPEKDDDVATIPDTTTKPNIQYVPVYYPEIHDYRCPYTTPSQTPCTTPWKPYEVTCECCGPVKSMLSDNSSCSLRQTPTEYTAFYR